MIELGHHAKSNTMLQRARSHTGMATSPGLHVNHDMSHLTLQGLSPQEWQSIHPDDHARANTSQPILLNISTTEPIKPPRTTGWSAGQRPAMLQVPAPLSEAGSDAGQSNDSPHLHRKMLSEIEVTTSM